MGGLTLNFLSLQEDLIVLLNRLCGLQEPKYRKISQVNEVWAGVGGISWVGEGKS